jgi:hypothetical protein
VNCDASDLVPKTYFYARGKQNSVLLLEPLTEDLTKVTFCVESNPLSPSTNFAYLLLFGLQQTILKKKLDETIRTLKDDKKAIEETIEKNKREILRKEVNLARYRISKHRDTDEMREKIEETKCELADLKKKLEDSKNELTNFSALLELVEFKKETVFFQWYKRQKTTKVASGKLFMASSDLLAKVFPGSLIPSIVAVTIPLMGLFDIFIDPGSEQTNSDRLEKLTAVVDAMGPLVNLPATEVITPAATRLPRKARTEAQRLRENQLARER